jgi:hypothetical protein
MNPIVRIVVMREEAPVAFVPHNYTFSAVLWALRADWRHVSMTKIVGPVFSFCEYFFKK